MTPPEFLRQAVANQAAVSIDKVQPTTHLTDDLGFDSLDVVEIVMALEEEYGVQIDETTLVSLGTLAEATRVLQQILTTSGVKKD